jgi:tripartite ATP-independent transporter DctM subunit
MISAIVGCCLVLLLAIGMPVAFAFVGTAFAYLVALWNVPFIVLPQKMVTSIDSFPLMAVPFFVLVGLVMNTGGATDRIFQFARRLVGHIPGGLGHANVAANMIMAGMSGSAVADAAGLGQVIVKAMVDDDYDRPFIAALTASGSTIGPIIPPSIAMVVYGSIVGASVPRLLLGGLVPGVLMGLAMMAYVWYIAKKRGYPRHPRATLREVGASLWETTPALLTPVILLGGMVTGIFTPTEAAAVAAAYAVLLTCFIQREMDLRSLVATFVETVVVVSVILIIIAAAGLVGWILNWQGVNELIGTFIFENVKSPALILLFINIFLLIVGCFIEANAALITLTPILFPIIVKAGIDPVHFGVMMVLNLMIGLITPPVGMSMYILCDITKVTTLQFSSEIWPFVIALVVVLILVTYVPALVLFVPDLVMGK